MRLTRRGKATLAVVALGVLASFVFGAQALGVIVIPVLVAVVVITPLLHLVTNGIAYALGLKDEPW